MIGVFVRESALVKGRWEGMGWQEYGSYGTCMRRAAQPPKNWIEKKVHMPPCGQAVYVKVMLWVETGTVCVATSAAPPGPPAPPIRPPLGG